MHTFHQILTPSVSLQNNVSRSTCSNLFVLGGETHPQHLVVHFSWKNNFNIQLMATCHAPCHAGTGPDQKRSDSDFQAPLSTGVGEPSGQAGPTGMRRHLPRLPRSRMLGQSAGDLHGDTNLEIVQLNISSYIHHTIHHRSLCCGAVATSCPVILDHRMPSPTRHVNQNRRRPTGFPSKNLDKSSVSCGSKPECKRIDLVHPYSLISNQFLFREKPRF